MPPCSSASRRRARGRRSPASSSPATRSSGVTPRPWATCSPRCPGVYLWRGGFIGRPEPVNFQGRGATLGRVLSRRRALRGRRAWTASRWIRRSSRSASSTGSRWSDGPDCSGSISSPAATTAWRPARASPSPAVTATSPATKARSSADSIAGSASRWPADYLSSPTASGASSTYSNTQVWAAGELRPRADGRAAVPAASARRPTGGRSSSPTRPERHDRCRASTRRAPTRSSDWRCASATTGLGPGLDLLYARTGWDGAGLEQQIDQIGGYALAYRAPTFAVGRVGVPSDPVDAARCARHGSAGLRSRPFTAERRSGAPAPLRRPQQRLRLPGGRAEPVRGPRAHGHRAARQDGRRAVDPRPTRRRTSRDFEAAIGFERGAARPSGSATLATAAFSPFGYAEFLRIPSLAPVARDRVGHGRRADRAASLDHPGGLVQRSAGGTRRGHPADPLADRRAPSARSSCASFPAASST